MTTESQTQDPTSPQEGYADRLATSMGLPADDVRERLSKMVPEVTEESTQEPVETPAAVSDKEDAGEVERGAKSDERPSEEPQAAEAEEGDSGEASAGERGGEAEDTSRGAEGEASGSSGEEAEDEDVTKRIARAASKDRVAERRALKQQNLELREALERQHRALDELREEQRRALGHVVQQLEGPPPEPPDYDTDPEAWHRWYLEQQIGPMRAVIGEDLRRREAAMLQQQAALRHQQFRTWVRSQEQEFAATDDGKGYEERFERWARGREEELLDEGRSPTDAKKRVAMEMGAEMQRAAQAGGNPVIGMDRWLRFELDKRGWVQEPGEADKAKGGAETKPVDEEIEAARHAARSSSAGTISDVSTSRPADDGAGRLVRGGFDKDKMAKAIAKKAKNDGIPWDEARVLVMREMQVAIDRMKRSA